MKPITREWVDKAEGDWPTADREVPARRDPNHDAACFHAQQCAEKELKASLQEAGIVFARTHYLLELLRLALAVEPTWSRLQPSLSVLGSDAVDGRYPGRRPRAPRPGRRCRRVRSCGTRFASAWDWRRSQSPTQADSAHGCARRWR